MPPADADPDATRDGPLGAVLLNYRTPEDTLRAADAMPETVDRVLLVDNGSPDDSARVLRDALPDDAQARDAEGGTLHEAGDRALLRLPENRGFTGGHNAAIRVVLDRWDPGHVLLQNPDAHVPGAVLEEGLQVLDEGKAAVASFSSDPSPRESLLYRIRIAGRYPLRSHEIEPGLWVVPQASGMAQLFPRGVLDGILEERGELFREDLFLFFDELELGWWLHLRGERVVQIEDDRVEHDVGASTDTLDLPVKEYYTTRNVHLVARAMPGPNRLIVHLLSAGWSLLELAVHLARRDGPRARAVASGLRHGLAGRGGQWPAHAEAEARLAGEDGDAAPPDE